MRLSCCLHLWLILALGLGPLAMIMSAHAAQAEDDGFAALEHNDAGGATLLYRLLKPASYDATQDKHPLLIFLHGAGERGADNKAQLVWGKEMMRTAAKEYGSFVLVPQCPPGSKWNDVDWGRSNHKMSEKIAEPMRLTMEVVAKLQKEYRIDPDRVYLMGLSMGGYGTWDSIARWPDMFAAAVPICGGGDETVAERIKCPVWAFHGDKDPAVPVARSRNMVEALKKAGQQPKYTEYPDVGHDSWVPAFKDPEMLKWLFGQKRPGGK